MALRRRRGVLPKKSGRGSRKPLPISRPRPIKKSRPRPMPGRPKPGLRPLPVRPKPGRGKRKPRPTTPNKVVPIGTPGSVRAAGGTGKAYIPGKPRPRKPGLPRKPQPIRRRRRIAPRRRRLF